MNTDARNQDEVVDSATSGTLRSQGVASNAMGNEVVDSATSGTPHSQGLASKTMGPLRETEDDATPSPQGSDSFHTESSTEKTTLDLRRRDLLEELKGNNPVDSCIQRVLPFLRVNLSEHDTSRLKADMRNLLSQYKRRMSQAHRTTSRFEEQSGSWFDKRLSFPCSWFPETQTEPGEQPVDMAEEDLPEEPCSSSSQTKTWEEKTRWSKRREVSDVSNIPTKKLLFAATIASRREGDKELTRLLRQAAISPARPSKIMKAYGTSKEGRPYTPEEALAQLLDEGLSKATYENIRRRNISLGWKINPPYSHLLEAKGRCRPPSACLKLTEVSAEVPLQALLEHTAIRIVELQEEVILQYHCSTKESTNEAQLICTWGFDGSSSQSNYKQAFQNDDADDSSMFATTVVPLRLVTPEGHVLWNNRTPQSVRFCRPLHLRFTKETREEIKSEKFQVEKEIEELEEVCVDMEEGHKIVIRFALFLTVIDGKVLSAITDTRSSLACPLCGALPSSFNKTAASFVPNPQSLKYGISPLHAWIRMLEFCLHLSYKLEIRNWQARGQVNKDRVKKKKEDVQKWMKEALGLIVDVPKQGAGTSNDGNTARRAFEKWGVFASLLGLDPQFVEGLQVLLIAMSCQLPLNSKRFGDFCSSLKERYISLYPWYYMPVTAHKILVHGADIIEASALPLGMMAEDAAESRNKLYRQDRLFHARKTTRKENLKDVFNRAMDTSDPFISSMSLAYRQEARVRKPLPVEVVELLEEPTPAPPPAPTPAPRELFPDDEASDEVEEEDIMINVMLDREPYDFETD